MKMESFACTPMEEFEFLWWKLSRCLVEPKSGMGQPMESVDVEWAQPNQIKHPQVTIRAARKNGES
jgi:hypothetical protein